MKIKVEIKTLPKQIMEEFPIALVNKKANVAYLLIKDTADKVRCLDLQRGTLTGRSFDSAEEYLNAFPEEIPVEATLKIGS